MKSKFVKIAALLMVAVLATSCVLSSTLAYYKTSSGTYTDTARVAKWEWNTPSVTSSALFAKEYTGVEGTSAHAASTVNIIAPGTSGNTTFTVTGTPTTAPEVDYEYGWTIAISGDAASYLKFGKSSTDINSSASEFVSAINAGKIQLAAGTAPTTGSTTLNIYWKWDFGTTGETAPASTKDVTVTAAFEAKQIYLKPSQPNPPIP